MREGVTIQQLRALSSLGEGGSFESIGDSGRQAGYQLIRRLDHALFGKTSGQSVATRAGRELTPAGRQLVADSRQIVELLDRLVSNARQLAGHPSVEVSCLPAHVDLVDRAAARWTEQYPRGSFRLRDVSDSHRSDHGRGLSRQVQSGASDLAIIPSVAEGHLEGAMMQVLYRWPLVAVIAGSQPGLSPATIDVEELGRIANGICVSPPGHTSRELLAPFETRLSISFESSSVDALVTLGQRGRYTAIVPGDSLPIRVLREHGHRFPRVTAANEPIVGLTILLLPPAPSEHTRRFAEIAQEEGARLESELFA